MLTKLLLSICLAAASLVNQVSAIQVSNTVIAGKSVTICRVNVRTERLQLFLHDDTGQPFKSFESVDHWLQSRGQKLVFGMNAGMYHRDFSPVGLYVAGGRQRVSLNTNNGTGNFYLKPNGVFLASEAGARIVETSEYPKLQERVIFATQSGPMLVRGGKIHSAFKRNSESRVVRNGIGVPSPDVAVFAISEDRLNFYEFATLFRDVLGCPDALYLDGVISSLYVPQLGRSDKKADLGPIIGVVE